MGWNPLWKRKKRKIGGAGRASEGSRWEPRSRTRAGAVALEPRFAGLCRLNDPRVPPQVVLPPFGEPGSSPGPAPLLLFCLLPAPTLLIPDLKFKPGKRENTGFEPTPHPHPPLQA